MKIHELKIYPQYFSEVLSGNKTFELRKNDRGFEVGDVLILKEFTPGIYDSTRTEKVAVQTKGYTGKEIKKVISYIYKGCENGLGLRSGFCILGLQNYIEYGHITDKEIDEFGKFSEYEKSKIKEMYSKYPKGTFKNPMCALY
ncbi:DUF3850 domain-containing protein [Clostridium sp.]|uniref:DUF3850 domain-containing protein n=1 Tax=Clostridium sp. TaxID=1506 RepID=UPI0029077690|nr:DUF3850 domain-containing protein [Clostridium sp.]MDU7365400.1 DUF3850 domain-containing protein [Clostridium sp.]